MPFWTRGSPDLEKSTLRGTGSSRRLEEKWKHLVELDQRMKLDPADVEAEKHRIGYRANLLRKYAVNGSDSFERTLQNVALECLVIARRRLPLLQMKKISE